MIEALAWAAFIEAGVRLAIPLVLAALGEMISERAGVLNIGLEGSIIAGALGAALGALATGSAAAGVLIGAAAGVLVGLAFAVPQGQPQLVQALNAALTRLESSGELETIMLTAFPLDPLGF